jgi:DNA replication protein DnaC
MNDETKRAQQKLLLLREQANAKTKNHAGYEHIGAGCKDFESRLRKIANDAIARAEKNPAQIEEIRQRETERMRSQLRQSRQTWLTEFSKIPPVVIGKFQSREMDLTSPAILAATRMVRSQKKIIGLLGPSWSGKTVAACFLLFDRRKKLESIAMSSGAPVIDNGRFITAPEIARIRSWEIGNHWVMKNDWVIIDDIGRELDSQKYIIEEVIIKRYDRELVTIFTSNLTNDEFENAYDERVISRINRVGGIAQLSHTFSN